jgi:hypothetical protein
MALALSLNSGDYLGLDSGDYLAVAIPVVPAERVSQPGADARSVVVPAESRTATVAVSSTTATEA